MPFIDDVTAIYCKRAKFSNLEKQRINLFLKMTIAENLRKNVFDLLYLEIFLRQSKLMLVVNGYARNFFRLLDFEMKQAVMARFIAPKSF